MLPHMLKQILEVGSTGHRGQAIGRVSSKRRKIKVLDVIRRLQTMVSLCKMSKSKQSNFILLDLSLCYSFKYKYLKRKWKPRPTPPNGWVEPVNLTVSHAQDKPKKRAFPNPADPLRTSSTTQERRWHVCQFLRKLLFKWVGLVFHNACSLWSSQAFYYYYFYIPIPSI